MKTLFVSVLTWLACLAVQAQLTVQLSLDQEQFLPNESIRLAVKITNTSGQQLHLGADQSWLTFSAESEDGSIVSKLGEVPVVDEFDVESSQIATKHVNIQPYFQLSQPGRYKITATVFIKDWSKSFNSLPIHFDIINGAELWSQNFGVVTTASEPPEARKYSLVEANYLRKQLQLYAQISSGDGSRIFKVSTLGPLVSFSAPEAQVDRTNQLHVLWQMGAQAFCYAVVNPDGTVQSRDIYDNFNSRPRLKIDGEGQVLVVGGVRRLRPSEIPASPLPAPAAPAPVKH